MCNLGEAELQRAHEAQQRAIELERHRTFASTPDLETDLTRNVQQHTEFNWANPTQTRRYLSDDSGTREFYDHALERINRTQTLAQTGVVTLDRAYRNDMVLNVREATLTQAEYLGAEQEAKSSLKSADTIRKNKLEKKQKPLDAAAKRTYEKRKSDFKRNRPQLVEKTDSLFESKWYHDEVLAKSAYKDDEGNTVSQAQLLRNVQAGDYSHVEQMDFQLRNMAATEYIRNLVLPANMTPETFVESLYQSQGVRGLMNPMLRVGMSLCAHTDEYSDKLECSFTQAFPSAQMLHRIEGLINAKIMAETMRATPNVDEMMREAGVTSANPAVGTPEYEKRKAVLDSITRNRQAQVFMAKTLFAAHIGHMKKKQGAQADEWDGPMANAFAHCSRVGFILPGSQDETDAQRAATTDAFLGKEKGRKAGFYRRMAATHAIQRKSKNGNTRFQEKKKKLGWLIGQNGMNVAVGGLNNNGLGGAGGQVRKLKNDGSCGHIYMHLEEGNASKHTGIMVGFESDGPGIMNQTGHVHGAGNGEFASSFGGQRTDEIGDKYGGREVDLTSVDQHDFDIAMTGIEAVMNKLLSSGKDSDAIMLRSLTEKLSGARMSPADLEEVVRMAYTNSPLVRQGDDIEMTTRHLTSR